MKLTKKKLAELRLAHREHNKRNKRLRLGPPLTFDDYVAMVHGKTKVSTTSCEIPSYTAPRQTAPIPSLVTDSTGACGKPQANAYSGKRKLIGVGTMHKSNMVPIFSDEEAEDIAKMRRN